MNNYYLWKTLLVLRSSARLEADGELKKSVRHRNTEAIAFVVRIDIRKFNILMYKVFYLTENISKYICNEKGAKMIFEDVNVVSTNFWLLVTSVQCNIFEWQNIRNFLEKISKLLHIKLLRNK